MLTEIKTEVQTSIAPLIVGLFEDSKTLFTQEIALARSEIRTEVKKAKGYAGGLALAMLHGVMALVFLGLTGAYLLSAYVPNLPQWGAFGIIAVVFGLFATASYVWGKKQMSAKI